jgi:hypothetical protein
MSEGKTTTDHDEIRRWAEERGGVPASVKGTEKSRKDDAGVLRLDFEPRDEKLEEISWEEFFEKFDREKLAFLYQEKTAKGETSRFHKFINRPAGAKSKSASSGKTASGAKSASGGVKASSAGKGGSGKKSSASKA